MKLVFEAMEQNGIKTNTMLQLKRNSPLMIEASDEAQDGDSVPAEYEQQSDNIMSAEFQQQSEDAALAESTPLIDDTNSLYHQQQRQQQQQQPQQQQPVATSYSHHIPLRNIDEQLPYVLEQSINDHEAQIEQLAPSILDFDDNMDAMNDALFE